MKKQHGFTLLELLITLVIASILAIFATSLYGKNGIDCKDSKPGVIERARIAAAIGQLGELNLKAQSFELNFNRHPTSIAELNASNAIDPWGNEYQFLSFDGISDNGAKRKDHNMVPVNKYFDIYSMGPDGKTATPFTSIPGSDDIVVANDGQYVGIACKYYTK